MRKTIKEIFNELNLEREDSDTMGVLSSLEKEKSVKRFKDHVNLCKQNLKNWK